MIIYPFNYLDSLCSEDIKDILYEVCYNYFSRNKSILLNKDKLNIIRRLGYISIGYNRPLLYVTIDDHEFMVGCLGGNSQREHIDISYLKTAIRNYKLRNILSEDN